MKLKWSHLMDTIFLNHCFYLTLYFLFYSTWHVCKYHELLFNLSKDFFDVLVYFLIYFYIFFKKIKKKSKNGLIFITIKIL